MSKLTEIRALLWQMRLKVTKHLGAKGLTIEDPEFLREIEELSVMNQTLEIPLRDLGSAQHAASALEQNLKKIPRDKRYGPAASVAGQQKEIDDLIREAVELRRLLEDLLTRVASGNKMEETHTVGELLEKAFGHEHKTEQGASDRPAIVPREQMHGSLESAVIMVFVLSKAVVVTVKKLMGKRRP